MKFAKVLAATVAVAVMTAGSLGCNTMKGVGRDVQKGGEGIEKTADKTQDKIHEEKAENKAEKKKKHGY